MKILHIVRSDSFAGVERHIAVLAAAQSKYGHEVTVIGGDPPAMKASLGPAGVLHLPGRSVGAVAAAMGRAPRPDVIHVHMTAAEAALLGAPSAVGIPAVATRHFAARRGNSRLGGSLAPLIRRRVGAQIAVSEYVRQHVDGPSKVIYAGLPDRHTDIGPAATRLPIVLVAQRLQDDKDTTTAIDAFANAGLADVGWRLAIAGAGPLRDQLARLAVRRGIARAVDFLGRRNDLDALMTRAAILLAPAPREHFGLTVLEAMGSGLPVVAADGAGHLESIGRVEGAALFPAGDARRAAQLLSALAWDPRRRDAYAARQLTVQRDLFTASRQTVETDEVYRTVL